MDELELLRGFRAEATDLAPEKAEAIRRAYRASVPWRPRRSRRRVLALAAGLAVAAAAVVLTVTLTGGQQTAAAAVLRQAASRLDSQPQPALPTGSYGYVRTRERGLDEIGFKLDGQSRTASIFTDDDNESWVADDGSGGEYGAISAPFAITDAGRAALAQLESVARQPARTSGIVEDGPNLIAAYFGSHAITPGNAAGLPTDEASLRALTGGSSASDDFWAISEALFLMPFDSQLDASLYRLAAQIPDVEQLDSATDSLGRPGVTIAIDNGSSRWALTIDPTTGRLLERSQTKISSDGDDAQVPIGTVVWRETILGTGIVRALGARPDGTRHDITGWTVCKPIPGGSPSEAHCVDPAG